MGLMCADMRHGFSEAALRGLEELERRIPSGVETRPLAAGEFAGHGGGPSPHYMGHRARLRTRFLTGGHAPMPEYELLELLLFNAIERIDVKPLAKRLLETFGDLNGVVAASEHRLLQVRGTTKKVYLQLRLVEAFAHRMAQAKVLKRCALSCWEELITYCRTTMAHRDTEQFRILFLDNKNVVIADEEQARGTVNHVPVYPREVVKRALELNASALILVHNHPSGDPSPSQADVTMTEQIVMACQVIDLRVHDHVIIGKKEETSFRTLGLL
ncbi:RadC family protein [Roseobacter sp. MH60115]|uniref:RadC family protein n=1 Tax=Roseobacter sp. MH60115 TaxID=2785324 RepID=UPI001E4B9D6E|nr:DNA repair protein RadC [Roseobacter sp. MH60115]